MWKSSFRRQRDADEALFGCRRHRHQPAGWGRRSRRVCQKRAFARPCRRFLNISILCVLRRHTCTETRSRTDQQHVVIFMGVLNRLAETRIIPSRETRRAARKVPRVEKCSRPLTRRERGDAAKAGAQSLARKLGHQHQQACQLRLRRLCCLASHLLDSRNSISLKHLGVPVSTSLYVLASGRQSPNLVSSALPEAAQTNIVTSQPCFRIKSPCENEARGDPSVNIPVQASGSAYCRSPVHVWRYLGGGTGTEVPELVACICRSCGVALVTEAGCRSLTLGGRNETVRSFASKMVIVMVVMDVVSLVFSCSSQWKVVAMWRRCRPRGLT